jgi:hypothetical protein
MNLTHWHYNYNVILLLLYHRYGIIQYFRRGCNGFPTVRVLLHTSYTTAVRYGTIKARYDAYVRAVVLQYCTRTRCLCSMVLVRIYYKHIGTSDTSGIGSGGWDVT